MGARIRGFGGEAPSLPREEPVIGRGLLREASRDLERQYLESRLIMDDLKDIIKAALFEVLEEVFKK